MDKLKPIVVDGFAQFKRIGRVLLAVYLPILAFFTVLGIVSRSSDDLTLSYLTRDVVALGDLPFFAGLTSQIGGMLWSATLAVCVFTLILLYRQKENVSAKRFLFQAAILTSILLLDDIFLVHEDIGPDYLNISEKKIVITYLLITLVFLFWNRSEILSSDYLILGIALGMFAMSIFLDGADLDDYENYSIIFGEQVQIFLEDGFKFVGIATWLVYFAQYGYQKIVAVESRN